MTSSGRTAGAQGNGSVAVFGATGFVGRHALPALTASFDEVIAVTRRTFDAPVRGVRVIAGGLGNADSPLSAIPPGTTVVNFAYDATAGYDANIALAEGLATLCSRIGAARLVHMSTAMVAGVASDRLVTESTLSRPATPYQQTKLAVEEHLHRRLRGVCPLVVLRPTAVFGRGGVNLKKLVTDLTTRPWYENYLRSCLFGSRPMNLVPVETVVAAALFAATSARAVEDGRYLVADDEAHDNNFRDVEAIVRRELQLPDYPIPRLPVPATALTMALKAARRLSFDPRTRFSSERLDAAGFRRPVTFGDALVAYGAEARALRPAPVEATR